MTSDVNKSFKSKLRALAQEQRRDPADLWQTLMLERFLARLAQTPMSNHFILKGAILLSKYVDIGRETRDLDFLARNISSKIDHLQGVFEKIAEVDLKDGFKFENVKALELKHSHMGYPGAEVSMCCYFGKTRSKISIDLGFGDIIEPLEYSIQLMHSVKGPLFENCVRLKCYPKEFIFAEKLETIVYRGALNSRMKDFHDLHSLVAYSHAYPLNRLSNILKLVFDHRQTPLNLPLKFTEGEIEQLQSFWNGYLKNLKRERATELPKEIKALIEIINSWLSAIQLS